ncbi:MAG TPA: pitrilysin family protein [Blastocatellia bacterium]|nr:pitrilysin family protein [Blastocatellia bacterium]
MRRLIKSRSFIISLAASLLFACAAASAGQQGEKGEGWRKQAPRPGPARPFDLPAAREARLENGLTLVMIEDRRTPLVTILAGIPDSIWSATPGELSNKAALREATAELLTEGAGPRTSEQLAREVETLGGQIASFASSDYAVVSAAVISENAGAMIDIFADVLARPSFPQSEVALYKNNRLEKLTLDRQDPSFLVREHFNRIIHGATPYGIIAPAPASVRLMTRAGVASFYRSNYSPAASVIIIVGDFDSTKMEAKARASLGKWKAPPAPVKTSREFRPARQQAARRIYLIDRPGSRQADFRIGNLAIARADADYFPLLVANAILGADTSSRLFLNIREQKGFAYDAHSAMSALERAGTFFGEAQTRTEVTLEAIKAMLAEFDRLRDEKVSAQELQNAKSYLAGRFSLALSTEGGIADELLQTHLLNLGADYLKNYRARIEAVTAEDVQRVARKRVLTDRPAIVVVGDATKLKKELSTLGPLVVLDAKGNLPSKIKE